MRSPFMQRMAAGLGERGVRVARFEFPYMQKKSQGQRTAPDRAPVLISAWKEALAAAFGGAPAVIGGKSMGGRIASMIADEVGAPGLLCLGYPFHPPKQPEKLRTAHLGELRTRTLIVQGTRDEMGTRQDVASYTLSKAIEILWIEDGDHSLTPRKRMGQDPKQAMQRVMDAVAELVITACSSSRR